MLPQRGVSADIDMALTLAAKISGEQITKTLQLDIGYNPEPPFYAGSPKKADPELIRITEEKNGHSV